MIFTVAAWPGGSAPRTMARSPPPARASSSVSATERAFVTDMTNRAGGLGAGSVSGSGFGFGFGLGLGLRAGSAIFSGFGVATGSVAAGAGTGAGAGAATIGASVAGAGAVTIGASAAGAVLCAFAPAAKPRAQMRKAQGPKRFR